MFEEARILRAAKLHQIGGFRQFEVIHPDLLSSHDRVLQSAICREVEGGRGCRRERDSGTEFGGDSGDRVVMTSHRQKRADCQILGRHSNQIIAGPIVGAIAGHLMNGRIEDAGGSLQSQ